MKGAALCFLCTCTAEFFFLGTYILASPFVTFGDASLDLSHGMLAVNLDLMGIAGLLRLVQEVWLWVEARLSWLVLVETYDKQNPHGIEW